MAFYLMCKSWQVEEVSLDAHCLIDLFPSGNTTVPLIYSHQTGKSAVEMFSRIQCYYRFILPNVAGLQTLMEDVSEVDQKDLHKHAVTL